MARKISLRWLVPLGALLALAIPATASAAVTSSSITTPTGPDFFLNDLSPGQTAMNITVDGTSNGTSGDTVDLKCYYGTSTPRTLAASVPVASDGTFTFTGVVNPLQYYTCMLRAVPHGDATNYEPDSNPSDDTFKGPVIAGSHYEGSGGSDADASGGGFYAWNSQLQGAWDVVSAGYCGIYDSYVLDPVTFESSNALFYCNGGFFPNTGGSSPRPYIKVDGTPAYAPSGDPENHNPGVNVNKTFDPATGQLTIQETDPIHFCSPNAATFPATPSSCTSGTPSGVSLVRTTVFDHHGRVATQSDQWSSTDGNQHALDVLYDQEFNSGNNDNSFMFRGSSSFQRYATNDTVSVGSTSPASFYLKGSDAASDGNEADGVGAVTYSSAPDNPLLFLKGSTSTTPSSYTELVMPYVRTVPATGTLDLNFRFSDAFTLSEVQGYAAEGEKAFAPAPPPPPPPAPPAPPAAPAPPAPPAAPAAALPTISITGAPSTKAVGVNILVNTGEKVSCPAGGQPCTVTVLATSLVPSNLARKTKRLVIGRTKFTIPAGQSRKITFKLNKKGAKALRKLKKMTVRLTVTARAGTGTPVTKVRTIKIKAPAKKRH